MISSASSEAPLSTSERRRPTVAARAAMSSQRPCSVSTSTKSSTAASMSHTRLGFRVGTSTYRIIGCWLVKLAS